MPSYIFLDESGDLGFDFKKKKTSKYFLITFLFVNNPKPIEKTIKKIFQSFSKVEVKNHGGILHAYKEKPKTRQRLLSDLAKKEVTIMSIYLNKSKVYTRLKDEKQVLYNYVTNILLDRIYTKKIIPLDKEIVLVAARRETNKFFNQNFSSYLEGQVLDHHKVKISIEIKTMHESKCLQAVDCVCWALFRKREHGDEFYANLIKSKIVEESPLFQ